jgi:uncharacterized protein (TIGR02145 family)
VWVIGNARTNTSFSATVQLLTATANIAGACAYASNYPPEAKYTAATAIEFTGTLPYDLVLEDTDGDTITRQSGNLFDVPPSYTLLSFTDKTGAPGVIKCIPPATFTLLASASGFCKDDMEGITFALDGTEKDKQYQLFRNNGDAGDGSVLTGNGSALTFTGTFNVAGTYTAWTVAEGLTCPIAMSGSPVVNENPLPANPDVTGDSRNCPGTVTLSASSSGAVIDWYDDVTTSTLHTGESYTTPKIETSTTYYVQARVESTGCLSAREAILAEVDMDGCCTNIGDVGVLFSEFNPCSTPAVGTTWTLTDDRDEKQYKVRYAPNGRYWMVQDLMFGNCTDNSLLDDSAAGAATVTPTVVTGSYVGHCRTPAQTAAGYVYNWFGVMNIMTKPTGNETPSIGCSGTSPGTTHPAPASCRGVCPFNWHVPTKDEFDDVFNALVSASLCTVYNCWYTGGWMTGTPCHFYGPGGAYGWQLYARYMTSSQSEGQYWTNEPGYAGRVGLQWFQSTPETGTTVRCVRNF